MFKPRPCGCKGIRTCLVCEADFGIGKITSEPDSQFLEGCLEFCHLCSNKCWPGQGVAEQHPHHEGESFNFEGVYLQPDFLTPEEEEELVGGCDSMEWTLSQSGRRKQNFGPKTNFKKKKISGKSFDGFPSFSKEFQRKLNRVPLLQDFITIEQCAIEYKPETGACIDPHIDDCWVWGERVLSINLLSDSTLTMTKYRGPTSKYNLDYFFDGVGSGDGGDLESKCDSGEEYPVVRIPMPRRSLLVLFGPARYAWEHCIFRKDITSRRICMAYREFTPEYLPNGDKYENFGKDIIEKSHRYFDL